MQKTDSNNPESVGKPRKRDLVADRHSAAYRRLMTAAASAKNRLGTNTTGMSREQFLALFDRP